MVVVVIASFEFKGRTVVTARSRGEVGVVWIQPSPISTSIPAVAVVVVAVVVAAIVGIASAVAAASLNRQWTVVMTKGSIRRTVRACTALS